MNVRKRARHSARVRHAPQTAAQRGRALPLAQTRGPDSARIIPFNLPSAPSTRPCYDPQRTEKETSGSEMSNRLPKITQPRQQTKTWIQAHPAPSSVLLTLILCGFLNDKPFCFSLTHSFADPTLPLCRGPMMLSLRLESFDSPLFYPIAPSPGGRGREQRRASRAPCSALCVDAHGVPARRRPCSLPGLEETRWWHREQPWGQEEVGGEHRDPSIEGQRSGLAESGRRGQWTLERANPRTDWLSGVSHVPSGSLSSSQTGQERATSAFFSCRKVGTHQEPPLSRRSPPRRPCSSGLGAAAECL